MRDALASLKISIVINSMGQANKNLISMNPICSSKHISDLGRGVVTKGIFSLTLLQLNIQGLSLSIDNLG